MPGAAELVFILIILLLVFGASRIPQIGEALGKGITNFKKASTSDDAIDITPSAETIEGGDGDDPSSTTT